MRLLLGELWRFFKKSWRRRTDILHRETPLTEDNDDLLPDLYVQKDTGLIFEVKFFDDFALVRPATPLFYTAIKKMSLEEFSDQFEEFSGDQETARLYLRGMTPDFVVSRSVN